jgi:hypothetical protein
MHSSIILYRVQISPAARVRSISFQYCSAAKDEMASGVPFYYDSRTMQIEPIPKLYQQHDERYLQSMHRARSINARCSANQRHRTPASQVVRGESLHFYCDTVINKHRHWRLGVKNKRGRFTFTYIGRRATHFWCFIEILQDFHWRSVICASPPRCWLPAAHGQLIT